MAHMNQIYINFVHILDKLYHKLIAISISLNWSIQKAQVDANVQRFVECYTTLRLFYVKVINFFTKVKHLNVTLWLHSNSMMNNTRN